MVKSKKDMWSWTGDTVLRNLFFRLSRHEVIFLVLVVVLDTKGNLGQYSEFLWGAVFGVFFLARFNVLCASFYFSHTPAQAVKNVDARIWILFLVSLYSYAGMLYLYPEALPALLGSARGLAKIAGFSSVIYAFYRIILEEFIFRFVAYYSFDRLFGRNAAFLGSVALFAFAHQHNVFYPVAVIPAGMMFTILTMLTGSVVPAVLLHGILNILVYLLVVYVI